MAAQSSAASTSYVCDTLPAPRLSRDSDHDQVYMVEDEHPQVPIIVHDEPPKEEALSPPPTPQQPPPRKLCVRHQRMADEGTNLKLQQSLDALPVADREAVNAIWSNFSSSSHPRRALILQGLLTMCCFSQLSLLTEQLAYIIRLDPFAVLPREVSLKILGYLDATSLCRAAQVTKKWKTLADDDVLWRGICEQHIGQKCPKCGWGLPVLEKKRTYRVSPCPSPDLSSLKRPLEEDVYISTPPMKRQRSELIRLPSFTDADLTKLGSPRTPDCDPTSSESCSILTSKPSTSSVETTRPWKDVYSERMTIERNWRRGRCTVRILKGHTDGVMCLQYSETLSHPAFPVLITGSYDRTARVWNLETGMELHCLKGHSRAIRALQFDEVKLITGSMDSTLKVWDWRRGKCIRTLTGHTEGVVSLNFDSNVLASGSVDSTIRVWNLRTGGAFTLRGHCDWVNSVLLWDFNTGSVPASSSPTSSTVFDVPGCAAPQIDPGKMLFSASDDGTIKLWDLTSRTCVRQFTGHVGQVQSIKLLMPDECDGAGDKVEESSLTSTPIEPQDQAEATALPDDDSSSITSCDDSDASTPFSLSSSKSKSKVPILISGSLDNTIKVWDIETGKTVRTFFGHIEGVWGVAGDKMRIVSASHDRTIKVWNKDEGTCTSTFVGHTAAVSCIALGEDKIISGSDDNTVRVWSFSG